MITRLSSVGVQAGDLDQAVEFYVEKLGFEKRRDDPMGPDARWVELAPPGAETSVVPFTPGLVFACDDIEATCRELRGRGVEFTEGPSEQAWGRWAQFRGPDGNEHALIEQG
jgi:catechol 2,3-dioxygenase-like lactoylglutathione lyase family enzyme